MIFLIRHGETEFNREGRLQGRLDSPLTELGVQQARRMGACLRAHLDEPQLFSVISSPLGRARRTAEIVCEELGLGCEIRLEPRLAELDVGHWEGLTREQVAARHPDITFEPGWIMRAPAGETQAALDARLSSWLADIDEADGRRRIVVCHGGAGRALRALYCGGVFDAVWPPQDAVFLLRNGVVRRVDQTGAG